MYTFVGRKKIFTQKMFITLEKYLRCKGVAIFLNYYFYTHTEYRLCENIMIHSIKATPVLFEQVTHFVRI